MAKKISPGTNINLSSIGKKTVSKVVYGWTIDAGRAIIVGIELIALIALGYRFVIDKEIVDLHDKIKTQGIYVDAQAPDEKNYRSIQERLKNIKATQDDVAAKIQVMNEIISTIATGAFFSTNLSINNRSIGINGNTFSIFTLNEFLEKLKTNPSVSAITIDEVSTTNEGLRFKTRIDIKDMTGGLVVDSAGGKEK